MGAFGGSKIPQLITPQKVELKKVDLEKIELGDARKKVVAENVRDFDDVSDFLADINQFNVEQQLDIFEQAIPGFSKLRGNLVKQATELSENPFDVPESVQALIETQAAQRGVTSGIDITSEAGAFDLIETFGLKGIELGQQNLAQAQSLSQTAVGLAPPPSPVNPFNFFSTTKEQFSAEESFESNRQRVDQEFEVNKQNIDQAFENAKAAVANQQAVLDSQKKSTFQKILGGVTGAVTGIATGGGIVGAGLGAAGGVSGQPVNFGAISSFNSNISAGAR